MGLMKGSLGGGLGERTCLIDPIANGLITLPNNHSYIHKGQHFKAGVSGLFTDTGDQLTICVTTPASVGKYIDTLYHMVWRVWSAGPASFGIYEHAEFTGGSVVTPMNNNRAFNHVHTYETELVVKTGDDVVISDGELLLPLYYAGSSVNKAFDGMGSRDDDEILLAANTTTAFELTSLNATDVYAGVEVAWYEYIPED